MSQLYFIVSGAFYLSQDGLNSGYDLSTLFGYNTVHQFKAIIPIIEIQLFLENIRKTIQLVIIKCCKIFIFH